MMLIFQYEARLRTLYNEKAKEIVEAEREADR